MTTAADRLLVDGPDPGDRIRQAVAVARGLDPGPRAALLADLASRGAYERRLAVTMAVTAGDGGHPAAAVRDPFPSVRAPHWPPHPRPSSRTSSSTDRSPTAPGARHELVAALVDVRTTATWRSAATSVLTATVWTAQPDLLPDAVAALVRGDPGPDAERLRDRPAR